MLAKAFVLASLVGTSMAMAAGGGPSQMDYSNSPAPRNGPVPTPLASPRSSAGPSVPVLTGRNESAAPVLAAYGGGGDRGGGNSRDRDNNRDRRDNDRDRNDNKYRGGQGWGNGSGHGYGRDNDHDRDRWNGHGRYGGGFSVQIGGPVAPAYYAPAAPVYYTAPAPVYYSPPVIRPMDVAPYQVTFRATQAGDTVIITACGSNRTGGFTTNLDIQPTRGGLPNIVLHNYGPQSCGYVTQCITAFDERGYFESCARLREVRIQVGCETICVPVEQVGALR